MQHNVDDEIKRVLSWNLADLRELVRGLEAIIQQRESAQPLYDVREFRGIGHETWKDVDVEEYLRQERASWDD